MGIWKLAVPVTGLAENFSPMPRMAPPPLGMDGIGAVTAPATLPALSWGPPCSLASDASAALAFAASPGLGFTSSADCGIGLVLESSPERRSNVAIFVSTPERTNLEEPRGSVTRRLG